MGLPNGSEWLILVLVLVLLFGAKKLPEAARGLGRSLRIFKSEVGTKDEPLDETQDGASAAPRAITQTTVPSPAPMPAAPAPAQSPVQSPAAPIVPVTPPPSSTDPTSVQSVNEHAYGQERSDR